MELVKFIETESRRVVARGWGKRDDGYKVLVWIDEKFLEMEAGDGGFTVYVMH